MLIDVYNRDHIARLPLLETLERGGRQIHSRRSWDGKRRSVELERLAAEVGLRVILSCAWFRESLRPSVEHARMQFLLAKD